jgi:hypothetical protein
LNLLKDRKPQLTLSCQNNPSKCNFQFWAGQKESFFCELTECDFKQGYLILIIFVEYQSSRNITNLKCSKLNCQCFPGRLLCGEGGSLDLTEWFESEEGPVGPGTVTCDEVLKDKGQIDRKCYFTG